MELNWTTLLCTRKNLSISSIEFERNHLNICFTLRDTCISFMVVTFWERPKDRYFRLKIITYTLLRINFYFSNPNLIVIKRIYIYSFNYTNNSLHNNNNTWNKNIMDVNAKNYSDDLSSKKYVFLVEYSSNPVLILT